MNGGSGTFLQTARRNFEVNSGKNLSAPKRKATKRDGIRTCFATWRLCVNSMELINEHSALWTEEGVVFLTVGNRRGTTAFGH